MIKQDKKLIVIYGISGSGKTYLANYLCKKEKAEYLDFDLIYDYKTKDNKTERVLSYLKNIVKKNNSNVFVLDGFTVNCNLKYISEKLNLSSRVYFSFAAPHIIKKGKMRNAKRMSTKI